MKSFVRFGAYAVAFAPLLGVVGFGLHELFIAKTGGSQVYLAEKEVFPVEEMLYALMIASASMLN